MKLIEIYSLLQSGEITAQQAADALGVSPLSFKVRCARWGHRLPLMLSVLDKITMGTITRTEAAEALEVTDRQVNKLSESWKVMRPISARIIHRATSKVKWEIRKKYAIDFIAAASTIEDASERAGVSTRQMRRWVSDLLQHHYEMVWKDLDKVPTNRRRRLAEDIETAEGLELAKQNVINAISRGEKNLEEEAMQRVMARRENKRRVDVRTTQ